MQCRNRASWSNLPVTGAACRAVILLLWAAASSAGCSSKACNQPVTSEADALAAVATFFKSDTAAARQLIAELRKDGMKDEFLAGLQAGCRGCVAGSGEHWSKTTGRWYVAALIAPQEDKKVILFEVECGNAVRIESKLLGA
jgi:hypothetical protein